MKLPFRVIPDDRSALHLETMFERYWPAYRQWMSRSATSDFAICFDRLKTHMPELIPDFVHLHGRFGASREIGRFLTLYNPPRLVRACAQLMLNTSAGPVLFRSYDHDPRLIDGIVLHSDWSGTRTLAVADCIWGALDGMNEHGLTIALAFGGRKTIGDGFAAPLICRYILQTCSTVSETREALARLPVYMSYTFAVLDASGEFITAFVGPETDATFVKRRASTNHQSRIDWPEYARFANSDGRLKMIQSLIQPDPTIERIREAFLSPPIWRTNYARASGTLYVAEYWPAKRTLDLHWPGHSEHFDLQKSIDRTFSVELPDPAIR